MKHPIDLRRKYSADAPYLEEWPSFVQAWDRFMETEIDGKPLARVYWDHVDEVGDVVSAYTLFSNLVNSSKGNRDYVEIANAAQGLIDELENLDGDWDGIPDLIAALEGITVECDDQVASTKSHRPVTAKSFNVCVFGDRGIDDEYAVSDLAKEWGASSAQDNSFDFDSKRDAKGFAKEAENLPGVDRVEIINLETGEEASFDPRTKSDGRFMVDVTMEEGADGEAVREILAESGEPTSADSGTRIQYSFDDRAEAKAKFNEVADMDGVDSASVADFGTGEYLDTRAARVPQRKGRDTDTAGPVLIVDVQIGDSENAEEFAPGISRAIGSLAEAYASYVGESITSDWGVGFGFTDRADADAFSDAALDALESAGVENADAFVGDVYEADDGWEPEYTKGRKPLTKSLTPAPDLLTVVQVTESLASKIEMSRDVLLATAHDAMLAGADYEEPVSLISELGQLAQAIRYLAEDYERFAVADASPEAFKPYNPWPGSLRYPIDSCARMIGVLTGDPTYEAVVETLIEVRDEMRTYCGEETGPVGVPSACCDPWK